MNDNESNIYIYIYIYICKTREKTIKHEYIKNISLQKADLEPCGSKI